MLVTSATSTPMAAQIGARDIFSLKKSFASGRLLQFKAGNKSPILKRKPFVYKRGIGNVASFPDFSVYVAR